MKKILFLLALLSANVYAADVEKTQAQLLSTFTNGCSKCITAQNIRDLTVSTVGSAPMGEVSYFNTTGTSVTIGSSSDGTTNMVKIAPITTGNFMMQTDNGGADNGRLRYTGTLTKTFHIAVTTSGTPATANDVFVMGVAKNGAVVASTKVLGSASGTQFSALHAMITLATNDYIELFVGNTTAGRNITIKSLNMFMLGMQ